MFSLRLEGLSETERVEAEFARKRAEIMGMPFSDEQIELLLAQQQRLRDAELAIIEEAQVAEKEKQLLDDRIANIENFTRVGQQAFDQFFAGVISGEKKFGEALAGTFKQVGSQLIDQKVNELLAIQIAEVGKATLEAPGTFGASLAKIPLILAAAAAGKAALGAIKFHEGGIVGGDINAPARDVPIIAQAGEAVIDRDTTRDIATGGAQDRPMQIINIVQLDGDEISRYTSHVRPQDRFI
jgi:hypothetical protein